MATRELVERAVDRAQKELFGGTLAQQGRGFYVTLELLAICRGVVQRGRRMQTADDRPLAAPDTYDAPVVYDKSSHDVARRLLHGCLGGNHVVPDDRRRLLTGDTETDATLEWVSNLLVALTVPRPFTRSMPDWGGLHLYPYVGELIHHDAVYRASAPTEQVSLERYLYRGGGALAYQLLRADPDQERLDSLRSEFGRVVDDSDTALGQLAAVLSTYDVVGAAAGGETTSGTDFTDDTVVPHDERRETAWSKLLREGCARILASAAPQAKQIEHLMHWVPYSIARHQLDLAARATGRLTGDAHQTVSVPIDFSGHTQIRVTARNEFASHRRWVSDAVAAEALGFIDGVLSDELARHLTKQADETTRFFSSTMAVVGALNANTGLRHYTLTSPLLEAMVFATVAPREPLTFDAFCSEVLAERLGLVVDARAADERQLASWIDRSQWELNASQLGERLLGLGLMTNLSDATRMVEAH